MKALFLQKGVSTIELLIALPVIVLLGLGALQSFLLFSAKFALNHAIQEAARAGAAEHADLGAMEGAFARALVPWLYGASDYSDFLAQIPKAQAHLAQAKADGLYTMRQLSPTEESFKDWSQPSIDSDGKPIPDTEEIPNDNLDLYKTRREPRSGVGGYRGNEPIGQLSGQTLLDANTLKLEVVYAYRLKVPLIGQLTAAAAKAFSNCESTSRQTLGLLNLGEPASESSAATPDPAVCQIQKASTSSEPLFALRSQMTLGMQSAARKSGITGQRTQTANQGTPLGVGSVDAALALRAPSLVNPAGRGVGQSVAQRPIGFTQIGADRTLPPLDPAVCR